MWKFSDFVTPKGCAGRFEVFAYDDQVEYCKVIAYSRTEAAGVWIAQALHRISLASFVGPDFRYDFTTFSKKCKRAGPNFGKTELAFILNLKPAAAIDALIKIGAPPEEELFVKPEKISVGPCALLDKDKTYVKARFSGHSVRFYFNSQEWLPNETEKSITHHVGGTMADSVYKFVTDNSDMIYKRAITRPLNLSEVDDYAQHNLMFLKDNGNGRYYPATSAELADPNVKLASLFEYGYDKCFAIIDDVVYSVPGFVSGWAVANKDIPRDDVDCTLSRGAYCLTHMMVGKTCYGYLRFRDCKVLDPRDQFVRQKIERSMKAKL